MEIKQQLKLAQQLVMTPQLQQAIRLLQLSRMELIDEIRKELDANPVLSDDEIDPQRRNRNDAAVDLGTASELGEARIDRLEDRSRSQDSSTSSADAKNVKEIDWDQFLENRNQQQPVSGSRGGFEDMPPIEQNLVKLTGLVDHLRWQLQVSDFMDSEKEFAELVLGNLDEQGFLDLKGTERDDGTRTPDLTLEELANEAGIELEDAEEVLRIMQEWDPVGACARDLRECLLVQAEVFGCDDMEITIIRDHMHNLEKHNYPAIAKDLKVSVEEIYEAVKEIQKLESRPARNFTETDEKTIAITPDVYIIKEGDKFVVSDNDRGVQRLYINESLTKQLLKDPNAKEFIGEKLRNAQWLNRATPPHHHSRDRDHCREAA
jgi:RNA polymerase sigma-54 factor